jgi:hypothetical protein
MMLFMLITICKDSFFFRVNRKIHHKRETCMHVIKRNEIVRDVFRFSMYIERDHARDHDDRRRREMLE